MIQDSQWAVFRQADGLLASDLHAVLPTDGAIWFGGKQGVSRFDGTWSTYPLPAAGATAPAGEDGAIVTALALTEKQDLLAATQDGRILQLVAGNWELIHQINAPVHALRSFAGAIWVGADSGLQRIQDGAATAVLPGLAVYAIQPATEVMWIGAEDGLWRLTPHGAVAARYLPDDQDLPEGAATAIAQDEHGTLWVGIAGTVVEINPETGAPTTYYPFNTEQKAVQITAIDVGADESVWVATNGNGVVKFAFENSIALSTTPYGSGAGNGLDTDFVRGLAIDAEGAIWFATPIGASRHYPWAWVSAGEDVSGLPIADVTEDAVGNLWVATRGEGVWRLQSDASLPATPYPGMWDLADTLVPAIQVTEDGDIWAATNNGVAVYSRDRWRSPIDSADLPSVEVYALAADNDGLWIGTSQGLARYSFAARTTTIEPVLRDHSFRDLQIDGFDRLWALTEDGDIHIRLATGDWLPEQEITAGLPAAARVLAIVAPPELPGTAFAAVEKSGIYRWDNQQWEPYGPHDEWLDGRILALNMDATGRSLWIGSNIGVGRLDEVGLTVYDARDGAANGAIRTITPADQGGYWFGGPKGLWRFKSEPLAPVLTSGAIIGGSQHASDHWEAYTDRELSLYFETGDIHTTADRIQVFYRVLGNGQAGDWREARGRSVPLRFAAPGVYAVELVARDLSFNYSKPVLQTISAAVPPLMITVPLLGEVEVRTLGLLSLFAVIACVGLGYVSFEYVRIRRRAAAAVRRGFNPYVSGEPVRRAEMFFGRQDLVERITATLHNNSIMIHGERRIGKTTLLYQLAHVLRKVQDKSYWFMPVYVDMEGTTETELFHLLMEDILVVVDDLPELSPADRQRIAALHYWTATNAEYDDRIFGRDLRTLMTILEEYTQQHKQGRQVRLILLMDEMDTLSRFDHVYQQQLRRIFMRDFAATLGAVAAGIELSKEWDRVESPWFNLFNEIEIQPLSNQAARELLVKPVQHYYRYDEDALQFILKQCDGRPFRLQQYGLESVNHMIRQRRRRITMTDVLYAHNLIQSEQNIQSGQAGLTMRPVAGKAATTLLNAT